MSGVSEPRRAGAATGETTNVPLTPGTPGAPSAPSASFHTPAAPHAWTKPSEPGLAVNLHGRGHDLRYHAIEDARSVSQMLDASLVPPDRSLCEVATRRAFGNWVFFVPATIGVVWLSTVISDLAVVTSVLLSVLVLSSFLPAAAAVGLAVPRLVVRPFTRYGRPGYLWFWGTTLVSVLDCCVYATCLFLLARAGGYAHMLPLLF
jgi:hypothetical protein